MDVDVDVTQQLVTCTPTCAVKMQQHTRHTEVCDGGWDTPIITDASTFSALLPRHLNAGCGATLVATDWQQEPQYTVRTPTCSEERPCASYTTGSTT